ncbi:enoyl-ACP reductase FabI [Streptomyces djakartensis]|uniref:enoyl-ACP reductase FabI n=1 Tax=Streptomyces djakartensis TaxID=68193 RepID=UPI0034DE644E
MAGMLADKNILVTGVLLESSIAFHAAKLAQEQGANVILTAYGRVSLVERIAKRLPKPVPVVELDVSDRAQLDSLATRVGQYAEELDGVVHSIGASPSDTLGGNFLHAPWDSVAQALHVSAYSFASLSSACLPLMRKGGSIVGIDFDSSLAWPDYDWMGVAKASLESVSRYLARYLGAQSIRVNLVASGPIRTMASRSIPSFDAFVDIWEKRSPIHWDENDPVPTAKAVVALLSDWFPATTGEIVHVDAGLHAVGA